MLYSQSRKLSLGFMAFLSFAAPVCVAQTTEGSGAQPAQTQGIMRSLLAPLSEILPYAFQREAFVDPKNRPLIEQKLGQLAAGAKNLSQHGANLNRGFEFLAKSLARDIIVAEGRYRRGYYDDARFTIQNLTDNCIACHSSLPNNKPFPDAKQFFAKVDLNSLDAGERARLQIVGRQFEGASQSLEQILTAKDLEPGLIVMLGAMTDYLKLTLVVQKDVDRPSQLVDKLLARKDLTPHVRQQLLVWQGSLASLKKSDVLKKPTLQNARALMDEGRKLMQFPRDRDGLIYYVAASGLLADFIHAHKDRGREVAEAYYQLGIADSMLEHSFWVSRMEFDFESAIRLAPAADFAPKAYALLEEAMVFGYSGSSGTHLPDDVKLLLAELRELIKEAQGARKT